MNRLPKKLCYYFKKIYSHYLLESPESKGYLIKVKIPISTDKFQIIYSSSKK